MPDTIVRARRKRGPRCYARVVKCYLVTAMTSQADTWGGKRLVICTLTCGHELKKFSRRRYLVGERLCCPKCEAAADTQIELPPMELSLR